jgi:RNA-binding protein Musashi
VQYVSFIIAERFVSQLMVVQVPREESHKPDMQLSVKKLYVGGVKEPLTDVDLREYFSRYGTVTDVIVMKDREGQYRG